MSPRVRARPLVGAIVVVALLSAVGLVLDLLARLDGTPGLRGVPTVIALAGGGPALGGLGALIVRRRPRNLIGWVFVAAGLGLGVGGLAESHVAYSFAPGNAPLPGAVAAGLLVRGSLAVAVWGPIFAVLLLFPDGRLLSPRWRPLAWAVVAVLAGLVLASLLTPGPLVETPTGAVPDNPIGVARFAGSLELVGGAAWPLLSVCLIGAAASVVVRFRRSRGDERRQLKWLAWSASLVLLGTLLMLSGGAIYGEHGFPPLLGALVPVLVVGGLVSLPVSVTVAILRYRLWEIDRLVNRTLVYGAVTAVLAGTYTALVVGIQVLVPLGGSDVAVAASTLAVAVAFGPVRKRIQDVVDRRFDRTRYDSVRAVERLGQGLRDGVDVDDLTSRVEATVRAALSPRTVAVWLGTAGR